MGSPWKVRFLKDIIRQERPTVVFLFETLSSRMQLERIRMQINFQGMIVVEPQGRSGGLALFWKENGQAKLLSLSKNHIDVELNIKDMQAWRLTGFYGEPNRSQRRRTWNLLRHLARDSNLPWCILGDMNNIVPQLDKKGGAAYPQSLIDGFNAVLEDTGLQDMDLHGHQFTWERGRNTENWLEIRLDRALVTHNWFDLFPMAKLYTMEGSPSDHCPIYLEPKVNQRWQRKKRFRFENAWLTEPLCMQIVKDNWEVNEDSSIVYKVQQCGEKLEVWGREVTGCFSKRIKECKMQLKQYRNGRDVQSLQKYKEAQQQLHLVLDQKEIFWRQRSKQLWLQSGDKNTKYFHAASSSRRRTNKIQKLKDENGSWVKWQDGLKELLTNYYQELYSSSQVDSDEVINCVKPKISEEQNVQLMKEITEEEVREAIFHMHPDKAPGPDGMTPTFFQKHWNVVGKDVIKMTRDFFRTGIMIGGLNETNVVLLPKKKNPTVVGDLRPIALCNVLVKIITKVLANRMKKLLDVVVSDTQSAFIPGRLISDNIMISYEVMHYLKRKKFGKEGFMALKLDMSKAYDRIEWKFLEAILRKLGFCDWWVYLVMQCVTTVSYSVVHGEYEMGPIIPTRGIRQGDPLSPYLFIICAEGLSSLISKYEANQWIHGIKVCRKAHVISHMLFADDSYFYCKANTTEASKVIELLNVYEKASGQKINRGKSSVFFSSNVLDYNRQSVCQKLQMGEADVNTKYLGLPSILGRNKSAMLGYLKEKACAKVKSWDGNFISRSGKEVLIKSVAQALPTYAMNVFLLPLEITKSIEKTLSNFWWKSSSKNNSRLNWMSWERMTKHKSAGGMGFRDFRDFNLAMLEMGHSPSFIWRSICEAKNLIVDGVRWRIGTGKKINIIGQPWDQKCILDTRVPIINSDDMLFWNQEDTGNYSVRSAYKWLQQKKGAWRAEDSISIWAKLWKIRAPPKTINVVWREISNCLPTLIQLQSKRVQVQTECPVCHEDNETILHSLVTCSFAKQCWLSIKVDTQGRVFADFGTWLEDILQAVNARESAVIISLCWAIWRNRNDIVWNQRFSSVNKTVAAAKQYLTQWSLAQSRSSVVLLQPVHEGDGDVVWANPQQNSGKVSVDAAVFEDKEGSGFGLITRDSEGMLLQAKTGIFAGVVTPVLAEAMAVKEALSWIDRMKWMDVTLVSDCLVVVQAIRSITPMRSQFGNVIEECREYLRRLNKIGLYHVKRSANRAAHQLARKSYNYSGRSFNRDSIPFSVKRCIELDLSN
ncbi:hypothetical protein AgCh_034018 [Apium graveolens]